MFDEIIFDLYNLNNARININVNVIQNNDIALLEILVIKK